MRCKNLPLINSMNVSWVHPLKIIGADRRSPILIPLDQLFVKSCPKQHRSDPSAVILPFHLINGHVRFNDHAGLIVVLLINARRWHMLLCFDGIIKVAVLLFRLAFLDFKGLRLEERS